MILIIYFDLDGVLRDLCTATIGRQATSWDEKVDGEGIIDIVNRGKSVLYTAQPTEYIKVFNEYDFGMTPCIMTRQLDSWKVYTEQWINLWITQDHYIKFVGHESKLIYLKEGDLLVEDYPGFEDFSQIALVDRPYNWDVIANRRIYKPRDLFRILDEHLERC